MNIVVFDLDETLGYFTQFGVVWDAWIDVVGEQAATQSAFDALLDQFPEYLRPNIMSILHYIQQQKVLRRCSKVMIYTNNNGPRSWAEHIVRYFDAQLSSSFQEADGEEGVGVGVGVGLGERDRGSERRIPGTLFDQVIAAFKVNGQTVELGRTSHHKSHQDLIRCTRLPETAQICFIDDTLHPQMVHEHIYYIRVKPYRHDLALDDIRDRLLQSFSAPSINHNQNHNQNHNSKNGNNGRRRTPFTVSPAVIHQMMLRMQRYAHLVEPKSLEEYDVDVIVGKRLVSHLQTFFAQHAATTKDTVAHVNTAADVPPSTGKDPVSGGGGDGQSFPRRVRRPPRRSHIHPVCFATTTKHVTARIRRHHRSTLRRSSTRTRRVAADP